MTLNVDGHLSRLERERGDETEQAEAIEKTWREMIIRVGPKRLGPKRPQT
jgi:hypothetical protein